MVVFYDTYGEELEDVYGFFVELILETKFCLQKTRDCDDCEYQDKERNPEFLVTNLI